jgi:hypothetical protein
LFLKYSANSSCRRLNFPRWSQTLLAEYSRKLLWARLLPPDRKGKSYEDCRRWWCWVRLKKTHSFSMISRSL